MKARTRSGVVSRMVLALLSLCGTLAAVGLGPGLGAATASQPLEDPERGIFPTFPGFTPIRLDGSISVNGERRSTSVLRLDAAPAEVSAYLRSHFEGAPVDLLEREEGGKRILLVWDVHRERSLLFSVQPLQGGGSELIRSWAPLSTSPAEEPLLPKLPDGLTPISLIEDRLGQTIVTTGVLISERPIGELVAALAGTLRADGWEVGEAAELGGEGPVLEAHSGDELLLVGFGEGASSESILNLRYERAVDSKPRGGGP